MKIKNALFFVIRAYKVEFYETDHAAKRPTTFTVNLALNFLGNAEKKITRSNLRTYWRTVLVGEKIQVKF